MIKQIILLSIFTFYLILSPEVSKSKEKIMNPKFNDDVISEWLDLRNVSLSNFSQKKVTKVQNVSYEGLKKLTRVNLKSDTSKYYFFDKEGNCVMIYINHEDSLRNLFVKNIIETYGEPEEILRSRVGKTVRHYVYSRHGFAFSVSDNKIDFFEIFPNSMLEQYKKRIYIEPAVFIR